MAYAYPSHTGGDASASSSSLAVHSSPGKGHSGGQSRKGSDEKFDIIREFKNKIDEDENYLMFFQDRIRVEEEYIAGLKRCYSRSKAVDSLHDDAFRREEKPTTRRAWEEVRDYTTREIEAREALAGALREVVVKELVRLKEEQGRIRQGLKENMKHANEMYDEHAKNQLPRLKRNYFLKCQALEDHRRQENAIAMQAKLLADSPTSPQAGPTPLREHPNAMTMGGKDAYPLSPPSSTAPLPPASNPSQVTYDAPGEKKHGLGHGHGYGRLRAGSASGQGGQQAKDVLNDFAAQSKKGFNAFMQKLGGDKGDKDDGGGFVVVTKDNAEGEGLQRRGTARGDPARGMGTMRGVKVKREADEADKAYRLGVFHLESLRLRRDKLQTSAARNLEAFNDDLNKTLITTLEVYIDTMHGTAATNAQATEVPRQAIEQVNLDKDTSLFRTRLRAVDIQRTLPVPYHNYYVGECRSLIFGVSLTDYDFARGEGTDKGRPPTIVEKCIAAIDEKGLDAEGIYRISGRHAGVQKMIQGIELDEEKYKFDEKDDVFSISNVLKQYLRELPEAIFPMSQAERVKYTENRETHIHSNFNALRGRLRRMAPIHQTTFQGIVEHLSRVAAQSGHNKMDAKNLAVVFNTVLFGQEQIGNEASLLNMGVEKDALLEDLISYSDLLFGAEDVPAAPGVLPPGAALSRSGVKSYHPVADGPHPGSSRTKFRLVDPAHEALGMQSSSSGIAHLPPIAPGVLFEEDVQKETETLAATGNDPILALTPDEELDLLFDPSAIPQSLRDELGPNLHVRPLASTDLMRSHFGLLQTLTVAPPIAPSLYSALFAHLKACPETYYVTVVVDKKTDQLVSHGTVMVEQKYIHGGSSAAHIEDIVVSPDCRGGGVGKKMVVGLRDLAIGRGCYKVVLHCKEEKIPFYEKCGFEARSKGMAYYRSNKDLTPNPTGDVFGTIPPPQQSAFGNHLSIDTGPPLTVDLASEASPRSESSGSGITYSFPVPPNLTLSPAYQAPPLPPRPETTRQGSGFTSVGATEPPPLPARPEPTSPVVTSPTALEVVSEASTAPAWAAEGLGSSERATSGAPLLSPDEAKSVGVGEGSGDALAGRSTTPLPPGAAPPNLHQEPERIVTPRG